MISAHPFARGGGGGGAGTDLSQQHPYQLYNIMPFDNLNQLFNNNSVILQFTIPTKVGGICLPWGTHVVLGQNREQYTHSFLYKRSIVL